MLILTHWRKSFRKTLWWKRWNCSSWAISPFFHNIFHAICILKSFYSHISVAVCSFFEFGMVSKWCIREWVNPFPKHNLIQTERVYRQPFQIWWKWQKVLWTGRKYCGEKVEIARYKHPFPQCIQKTCTEDREKPRLVWGRVHTLTLSQTSPGFYVSAVQVFWKLGEKEKSLVTSISPFSTIFFFFNSFGELSAIFIKI